MLIKNKKITRVLLALSMIIMLFSNSFGAVISDNDGSAFITKKEFEALKGDFANQIKQYNESIDNKIDGAISYYLAGINLAKRQTLKFIDKDWGTIYEVNGDSLSNSWASPYKNFIFSLGYTNYGDSWTQVSFTSANIVDTTKYTQSRILVDAGNERNTMEADDYVLWEGINTNFVEEMNCTTMAWKYNTGKVTEFWYGGSGVNKYRSWVVQATNWTAGFANSNQKRWNATVDRRKANGDAYSGNMVNLSWNYNNSNFISAPSNRLYYKHVICFNTLTPVPCTDVDWLKTWNNNDDDATYWYVDNWATTGLQGWTENTDAGNTGNIGRNLTVAASYPGNYGTTSSTFLRPHVGVLPLRFGEKRILQLNNQRRINENKIDYIGPEKETLDVGYATFYLKKGVKLTWTIKIRDCTLDPWASSPIAYDKGKYKVYLAVGGFKDGVTPVDTGQLIKDKDKGTDYWETTNSEVELKDVEMPDSGIIYIKWEPSDSTVTTSNWISSFVQSDNFAYFVDDT